MSYVFKGNYFSSYFPLFFLFPPFPSISSSFLYYSMSLFFPHGCWKSLSCSLFPISFPFPSCPSSSSFNSFISLSQFTQNPSGNHSLLFDPLPFLFSSLFSWWFSVEWWRASWNLGWVVLKAKSRSKFDA